MDWKDHYRQNLAEHLDPNGDITPPWEKFPAYTRYTIGWRMGIGEDHLAYFHLFLETLDPALSVRRAYLHRHAPAPYSWARWVYDILFPRPHDVTDDPDEPTIASRIQLLKQHGLIASDIAYRTWLSQQTGNDFLWQHAQSPTDAARYRTREFWFMSRQLAALRSDAAWQPSVLPDPWQPCALPLKTAKTARLNPRHGLLTLAQLLCAGHVTPPWHFGLTPDDFTDSFENDMPYVDAFRLWGLNAFDDREHVERYLAETNAPRTWRDWCLHQFPVNLGW